MDSGISCTQRALVNRVLGQLDTLCDAVSAQEFGRLMQTLLGFAFETRGWSVTHNAVGVPDLHVEPTESGLRFAIEVKTGNPIVLSARDLDGVTGHGQVGVVAALVFPDCNPRWCFVDATRLSPGRIELRRLIRAPQVDFTLDVQAAFLLVVDSVPTRMLLDSEALRAWGEDQRRQGWRPVGVRSDHGLVEVLRPAEEPAPS
jgi:hypothetical protein